MPWTILMAVMDPVCSLLWFLMPLFIIFLIVRLAIGDADLTLQFYERWGKAPASMHGQVVWITGASSGIGEELAYTLAKAGCKLVLSARREEELNRVKDGCLSLPGNVNAEDILVLPFDLLETDQHSTMVDVALEHFKKIDVLVNNGARSQRAWIKDTPLAVDKEIIDLLVLSQVSLTKAVLPHWIERKQGHVVVTSSGSGKIGTPCSATYSLGKHALHGFFEAMRMEHSTDNIDVTLACPGPTFTNIRKHSFTSKVGKEYGELNSPEEKRMTAARCAELMTIAMANKQGEAWISCQPALFFLYAAQYLPDFFRMAGKMYGMQASALVRPPVKNEQ